MIKFLVPFDVCNYCTLIEAVEWIAYKSYPVAREDENHERFFESYTVENFQNYFSEYETEETELDKEFDLFFKECKGKNVIDSDGYRELNDKREREKSLEKEKYQSEIEDAKHELFLALRKGEVTAYGIFFDKMKEGILSLKKFRVG